MTTWVDELEPGAPDLVAAWSGIDEDSQSSRSAGKSGVGPARARRSASSRSSRSLAGALTAIVERLSDEDLGRDGGEGGWNVAQAIGHACDARAGLSLAAAKAAAGQWPPRRAERGARRPRPRGC